MTINIENATNDDTSLNSLRNVLSFLMEECDINDADLSRETEIPASTISRMRLNDTNPTVATLRPLAKFFSVSIDQLLGDEPLDVNRLPGLHNPTFFTAHKIPLISWDFVLDWIGNNKGNLKHHCIKWLSTEKEVSSNTFALLILSDSYGVTLRKGATIIINPEQAPLDGDLILLNCIDNNSIYIKQIIFDGTDVYVKSLDPRIAQAKLLNENESIMGVIFETRFSVQEDEILRLYPNKPSIFQKIPLLNLKMT